MINRTERMTAAQYQQLLKGQASGKVSKYHSRSQWYDGLYFSSQKELNDYIDHKRLLMAGEIAGFLWQGMLVLTEGSNKENRAVTYRPDLVIFHDDGTYTIREVKGKRTPVYINKLKIIKQRYPRVKLEEV